MNFPGVGLIDRVTLRSVQTELRALVADTDTATAGTLRQQDGGGAYDPSTGLTAYVEDSTALSLWRAPLTRRIRESVEGIQPGDVLFLATGASGTLPVAPRPGDRLIVGAETWSVYRVDTDPLTALYHLFCRRA